MVELGRERVVVREQEHPFTVLGHVGRGSFLGFLLGVATIAAYASEHYEPSAADEWSFYQPYYDIPWAELAAQVPTVGLLTGAWMSLAFVLGVLFVRRVRWPLATLLLVAPMLSGVFAVVPAVGAAMHFGSMSAPYVGPEILAPALIAGGVLLAATGGRSYGHGWLLSIGSTVIPFLVAVPLLGAWAVALDFDTVRPLVQTLGVAPVAAFLGSVIGALFGLWVAASLLLANGARALLDRSRAGSRENALSYRSGPPGAEPSR